MNILVTGANGQLGTALREAPKARGDRWIFTDVTALPGVETVYLDITDPNAVQIVCESEQVDVIVNCAAYTNVDKAEDDQATADLLNRQAPANLAAAAKACGATLIHISTDYVFRGDKSIPYSETDATDPTGVYGVTKLAGERAISESGCNYLIFRTAWLYSPWGKNFVKTMLQLMQTRPDLRVVCDQVGTPTYAPDLAALIAKVIHERDFGKAGLYHFTDEGAISWYDFAMAIRDLAGLENCRVAPCSSEEYPTKAQRPHYSVLDKSRVRETFGLQIPYWRDSLLRCLERLDARKA